MQKWTKFLTLLLVVLFAGYALAATISSTPLAPSPLQSTDKFPLGRSGSTAAYSASAAQIMDYVMANYSGANETTATIKAKLGRSTAYVDGYLAADDFATFNGKLSPTGSGAGLSGITPAQVGAATVAQGALADSALQPSGSGAGLSGVLKPGDVVNNLTAGGASVPLSAEQGKALQDGKAPATYVDVSRYSDAAAAIAVAKAGPGKKHIYFPSGLYDQTAALVIDFPCNIQCAGKGLSYIRSTSTTDDIFRITSSNVNIQGCTIQRTGAGTSTAGAAVNITTSGSATYYHHITDNFISGTFYGIAGQNVVEPTIRDNIIANVVKYGLFQTAETAYGDYGDWSVYGNTFDSNNDADAAVRWEGGGGFKLGINKILHYKYGFDALVADGITTSILKLDGLSMEQQSLGWIRLGRLGATGIVRQVSITGIQNAGNYADGKMQSGYGIQIGPGVEQVAITGGNAVSDSGVTYLKQTGGEGFSLSATNLKNFGTGFSIDAGASNGKIVPGLMQNIGTAIVNNSASTQYGIASTDIPTLNQSTTGNAATATALASAPSLCSTGNYPLGVDAQGNAQGCTSAGAGSGDIVGPASSTDNAIARFDGTTGKLLQNSAATVSDTGNISTAGNISTTATDTANSMNITNNSSTSARYPGLTVINYAGSYGGNPLIKLVNFGGASGSPSAVLTSQALFELRGTGHDGTASGTGGSIMMWPANTWTTSDHSTFLQFNTTSTAAAPSERVRITSTGNLQLGSATATSGAEKLQVTGSASVSANISIGSDVVESVQTAVTDADLTVTAASSKLTCTSTTSRTVTLPAVLLAGSTSKTITVVGSGAVATIGTWTTVGAAGSVTFGDTGAPVFTSGKRQRVVCTSDNAAATTTAAWDCYLSGGTF